MRRALAWAVLLATMAAFGVGVHQLLGSLKGRPAAGARATDSTKAVPVPGTLYLAQGGALYRVRQGAFKQLTPAEGWTQPALSPDKTQLVAVRRDFNSSDLYLLGLDGKVRAQLTHNGSSVVELNHWAFFPRFSPDGSSVFYSYDPKDPGNTFRVDLAVYALPVSGARPAARQWTYPNYYTGGDVGPQPLKNGGLVYSKFEIDDAGKVYSQVWIQARAGSTGVGLTAPADNCGQPSLSEDQSLLVMVCTHGQLGDLVVASLDSATFKLGTPVTLLSGKLVAAPAFSPDGKLVAFFAPDTEGGPFQLWTIGSLPSPAPPPSAQPTAKPSPNPTLTEITSGLALDSTSAPLWVS